MEEPGLVITCLRAYDPVAAEIMASLDATGIQYSSAKCEVMHNSRSDDFHDNDRVIIPASTPPVTLQACLLEKAAIVFGSNLEVSITNGGDTIFVKGRTVEDVMKLLEAARANPKPKKREPTAKPPADPTDPLK